MSLDFSKLHILVVEDVLPMRSLLAQLLKVLGVGRVSVAKDGREGYEKYRREKPDIIITDWCMPALDGVELTLKVRRDKESPNRTVPIILMTGFIDKSRIGAGRDGGVTEVIIKPFSARDIAKRIEHVTQNPRDFVVTNNYVGPSRRRKKPNISKEENRRAVDTSNIIHDRGMLEEKVGTGEVSVLAIERSQQVMDDNDFDFEPMAREYLDQLFKEVSKIK